MSVIVLDAGNSMIKARTSRRENCEVAFPHATKQLTEAKYASILARAGSFALSQDYIRVKGMHYVVGESAERHGVNLQRNGASRYTLDYYGIFTAATMARLYERSREVMVFGSHPPRPI